MILGNYRTQVKNDKKKNGKRGISFLPDFGKMKEVLKKCSNSNVVPNISTVNTILPIFPLSITGLATNAGKKILNNGKVDIEKIDTWEREHYERNKTIRETLDIIKNYTLTKPIADAYEGFMNNKELREIAFPFISPKHAIAALDIIPPIKLGIISVYNKNISSDAQMYAEEYNKILNEENHALKRTSLISNGGNAIRHAIWQAAITSQYGAGIARDAGDSHETHPYFDVDKRAFNNKSDADMAVDLLNNKIGRNLGIRNFNKSTKEIALLVLEEFWRNGLYSFEKGNNGLWYVQKKKLPDNIFNSLYKRILQLNRR